MPVLSVRSIQDFRHVSTGASSGRSYAAADAYTTDDGAVSDAVGASLGESTISEAPLLSASSALSSTGADSAGGSMGVCDENEFALSIRLVTAVVLGALVGMEPRTPLLNLGVRSLTLTSLTAALVTTIAAVPVGGATTSAVLAAPSGALVAIAGITASLFTLLLCRRALSSRNAWNGAAVVGLSATIGAACAAGQALSAAVAYLLALAVVRSVKIQRGSASVRDRLAAHGLKMQRPTMTLRVAGAARDGRATKVIEVGGNSIDEAILNLRRVQRAAEEKSR